MKFAIKVFLSVTLSLATVVQVNAASVTIGWPDMTARSVDTWNGGGYGSSIDLMVARASGYPWATYRGFIEFDLQSWYNLGIDSSKINFITLDLHMRSGQSGLLFKVYSMQTAYEDGVIEVNSGQYYSQQTLLYNNLTAGSNNSIDVTSGVLPDINNAHAYSGIVLTLADEWTNGQNFTWEGDREEDGPERPLITIDYDEPVIPEPTSVILVLTGLAGLIRRFRKVV